MIDVGDLRRRIWESPQYTRILLITCLVGMFSTTFTYTVVTVALKTVAHDLHSTPALVAWVITAPALAIAVSLPVFGRLGDVAGHRRVYLIGFLVSIVFSLLTAVAPNVAWLVSSRTIAQLAGTATWPASYAMLFRYFPADRRIRATAWANGTLTAASVTGVVIGGPLIPIIGWRPLFVIQGGLGALALLAAVMVLRPDGQHRHMPLDLPGSLMLGVTLVCLTLGINRLAADGPTPLALGLLAGFPLALWVLVRIEVRAAAPLLPWSMISNRRVQVTAISTFLLGVAFLGSFVVSPLLLQSVFGLSVAATSFITACRTLSLAVASPVASRLGIRIGERRLLIVGAVGVGIGMVLMAFGSSITSLAIVIASLIVTGWANGHAQPATVVLMANAVEQENFGLATSVQQMANQIGSVVGIALFTAIAGNTSRKGPFVLSFTLGAGLSLLAAVAVVEVRRREPSAPTA